MNDTTITPLQAEMLRRIARSEFSMVSGSEPICIEDVGEIWADTIIESRRDAGTFTSLQNAGLVEHIGAPKHRDATVRLTQAGYEAYKRWVSVDDIATDETRGYGPRA